jgi:hypothetical protein
MLATRAATTATIAETNCVIAASHVAIAELLSPYIHTVRQPVTGEGDKKGRVPDEAVARAGRAEGERGFPLTVQCPDQAGDPLAPPARPGERLGRSRPGEQGPYLVTVAVTGRCGAKRIG